MAYQEEHIAQVPSDGEPRELAVGDCVGNYRIERLLAEGGMGQVYAAQHKILPRRAALKVLRVELHASTVAHESMLQESRVLELLAGPSVTKIYDVDVLSDGRPWLAMELVEGVCLGEVLELMPSFSIDHIARLVSAIAEALAHAHGRGIVHCDVKPDNVMVRFDREGVHVKIVDWGIAQSLAGNDAATMTSGTPAYMAPEQIRGEPIDDRTDVYALGVVAYELLTGELPFPEDDRGELMLAHLEATPRRVSELRADVPAAFDELIAAMLAKSGLARPTLETVRTVTQGVQASPTTPLVETPAPCVLGQIAPHIDLVTEPARHRWAPQVTVQTPIHQRPRGKPQTLFVRKPRFVAVRAN